MTDAAVDTDLATGAKLARTLDDTTLRRVFPGAPADTRVPASVGALFGSRVRSLGGERRPLLLAVLAGAVIVAATMLLAGSTFGGIAVLVLASAVVGIVLVLQRRRATDDWFDRYASARGLAHEKDGAVPANVPMLRKGDRRTFPRVLTGTIDEQPARLALYTYTEETTDSEGNRSSTDYDFTVLHFTLSPQVAARFAGVSLGPRSFSFGALQDKLMSDRRVQLESAEFHKRYSLRALDSQDDIALWELFSPPFIQLLATQLTVYFEQRGADLVLWRKGHEDEAAKLDAFCLEAWQVLHRYLEEWR
jgi:hypothetical protein